MRRFITYLYDYEDGTKGKGKGFVRVDLRGREVRMEVHVRNANHFQGKGKMYLIVNNESVVGIYVGDVTIIAGSGDENLRISYFNMLDSGVDFSYVIGIAIRYDEGYLASNWKEENSTELVRGTFEVLVLQKNIEKEYSKLQAEEDDMKAQAGEIAPNSIEIPESENVSEGIEIQKGEMVSEEIEILKGEMVSEEIEIQENEILPEDAKILKAEEEVTPIQTQERKTPTYRKIQLAHIKDLPPKNGHLCNNSFLLHGFFNYNYLILKKEKLENDESWSLGVPGVYEQPEKIMAVMFGFPEFEAREKENKEPKEGTFGAWFIALEK